MEECRYRNWYERNLGTKWDPSTENDNVEIAELTDSSFKVYFDSARSPPHIWLESMIALYPSTNFKLFCTDEMLQFTAVLFNDENGLMVIEEGKYVYLAPDGREVYLSDDNNWLYSDNKEAILISDGEYVCFSSSVENYVAWFEK